MATCLDGAGVLDISKLLANQDRKTLVSIIEALDRGSTLGDLPSLIGVVREALRDEHDELHFQRDRYMTEFMEILTGNIDVLLDRVKRAESVSVLLSDAQAGAREEPSPKADYSARVSWALIHLILYPKKRIPQPPVGLEPLSVDKVRSRIAQTQGTKAPVGAKDLS